MSGPPNRRRRALMVPAGLLLLTSCGGNEGADAGDDPPATTTTTAAATEPSSTVAPSTSSAPDPAPAADPNPVETPSAAGPDLTHDPPTAATQPHGLAAQLVEVERTVRDPSAAEGDLIEAAHLQQVAYRVLADRPEWDESVGAQLPGDLLPTVMANVAARRELRSMHRRLLDTLPAWRVVEPRPIEELLGYYAEAERVHGVPWQYLAAINLVETGMGRVDGISTAGAQGPMQFMPATWEAFGEGDVHEARDAIMAAGRYLAHSGAPGNMGKALLAYNRSGKYVRAVTHFAGVMAADPAAYRGYYHWQVYVLTVAGDVLLPVGYEQHAPIPVHEYLAAQD